VKTMAVMVSLSGWRRLDERRGPNMSDAPTYRQGAPRKKAQTSVEKRASL
jgi:hypothetical protein